MRNNIKHFYNVSFIHRCIYSKSLLWSLPSKFTCGSWERDRHESILCIAVDGRHMWKKNLWVSTSSKGNTKSDEYNLPDWPSHTRSPQSSQAGASYFNGKTRWMQGIVGWAWVRPHYNCYWSLTSGQLCKQCTCTMLDTLSLVFQELHRRCPNCALSGLVHGCNDVIISLA